ncbi:hypothetical protein ATY30_02720 [Sinorhizobium americanum]|uniref:Uncharacterized protein n=1 Tax=Sinorhizobium americanum TaxID=194963 RepID=A0A2S3YQM7_9HYPH|nr:hypothetical protein CO656_27130 [Sinorhizobium sp. FG01]PDT49510.1 hypothetical protein CO664_27595 [Sinorhizobium sp. NG07B]POH33345.1 hypothetical protein ATY30_02720 [Sinorhizobium americanum]POH33519.1 hypothetical protein ATY31_10505 [Sinorhizobium americanum]
MDKQTTGAWVVHHGRKIAADLRGAAEFSAIDLAAKAASLLARLGESDQSTLSAQQVTAAAKIGNLNPKTELGACLDHLQKRKLIDRASNGGVSVLGVNGASALMHAADLFDDNDPQATERAAISLAELSSQAPVSAAGAIELISDTHKMTKADSADFVQQASQIGFVDVEGEGADRLLFNGNLFRRDTAKKVMKVLGSLSSAEQAKLNEFDAKLQATGAIVASEAGLLLGEALFSKVRAAALYDMNIVSNEAGDHVFITSPGAFHKFSNPLTEDAFDHAKALVAALSYGMSQSSATRGRIWGIDLLLGKLIRGGTVGPAPAIGNDYRALELERVVKTERAGNGFTMRLLKREVGVIALEVLKGRNAAASALETLPSAGMRSYTPPEVARVGLRKNQSSASKAQTRSLLSAVRGGGGL